MYKDRRLHMECRDLNLKMFVWMCQPYNFEHFALLPWFLGLWSPALFQVGDAQLLNQPVLVAARSAATHDFMFILSVRLGCVQQLSAEELCWDGSWQESFLLEHWPPQLTGAV